MSHILITHCNDHLMWYSDMVGQVVLLLREEPDCFISREPAGFTNIVHKRDAARIPEGYRPCDAVTLLQKGDLVAHRPGFKGGDPWRESAPDEWGKAKGRMTVIRPRGPLP